MAIKKSDLYSSLWASCDELRGGMDGVLTNIETALSALEQGQNNIRALKQGMMQELLTGRTRLV
jgi:type I restriction enzyme S subunit